MATPVGHACRKGMLCLLLISAACGKDPVAPATVDGLYRMTWTLSPETELHQDVLLLSDGTFAWGYACCLGGIGGFVGRLRLGTWSRDDDWVDLAFEDGSDARGALDGDSLTFDCSRNPPGGFCTVGYHRMQTPAAWTGTYVLASVNGRPDRILEECAEPPETECQQSTHADTISVLHGTLFRRGRNESTPTVGLYSTLAGSIAVGPQFWVLWDFGLPVFPSGTVSAVDTLWVSEDGLARRRYGSNGDLVFEEEYVTVEGRIPGDP